MKARLRLGDMFVGLLLAGVTACGTGDKADRVDLVALSDGTYRVVFGHGYQAADEARLLAVTATLDRATSRLVFTMADGSKQWLGVTFSPRSEWRPDCFTMASHSLDEVATLTPAPLQLESLTFATPVVYAMCGPTRMILSNAPGTATPFLALDLQ
jgi:hypothetical protein